MTGRFPSENNLTLAKINEVKMIYQKKEGMSSLMSRDNKTIILRLNVGSNLLDNKVQNTIKNFKITLNRRKYSPINIKEFVKL